MFNLKLNDEELDSVINQLVPEYQRNLVREGFFFSEDQGFDQLGLTLTGENQKIGLIVQTSATKAKNKSMWLAIKAEVYEFVCTSSKKYSKERNDASSTIRNVVTILASSIAGSFNIAYGVITGAVMVALMSVIKMGKHAWCEINMPE